MADMFLSIGSNSGDRLSHLNKSLEELEVSVGPILTRSSIYETQSWGYEGQDFLNMAVKISTRHSPSELLKITRHIEKNAGRIKTPLQYTDRNIDLDILFYDEEIIHEEQLTIPHPRLHERLFVLLPMADIAPDYVHPVLHKTIVQLRTECADKGWIRLFSK